MPTWLISLIIELVKLIIPIIKNINADEKPNKIAAKEMVNRLRDVVGEPPGIKKI